jgi:hypothetical protein
MFKIIVGTAIVHEEGPLGGVLRPGGYENPDED